MISTRARATTLAAPAAVPPPPPPRYPNHKLYRNRGLGRFFGEYLILFSMSVLVLIGNMLLKRKYIGGSLLQH
jgi:hypothetical protein